MIRFGYSSEFPLESDCNDYSQYTCSFLWTALENYLLLMIKLLIYIRASHLVRWSCFGAYTRFSTVYNSPHAYNRGWHSWSLSVFLWPALNLFECLYPGSIVVNNENTPILGQAGMGKECRHRLDCSRVTMGKPLFIFEIITAIFLKFKLGGFLWSPSLVCAPIVSMIQMQFVFTLLVYILVRSDYGCVSFYTYFLSDRLCKYNFWSYHKFWWNCF